MSTREELFALLKKFPDNFKLGGGTTASKLGDTLSRLGTNDANPAVVEAALQKTVKGQYDLGFPMQGSTVGAIVRDIAQTWAEMPFHEKQIAMDNGLSSISRGTIAPNAL